jgi:hypothetical protein
MRRTTKIRRALLPAVGCGLLVLGLAVTANAQCQLNSRSGKIKHVVYVEFDNVHFTRDNPNVPSDLEQMPHLLNFIKQKGTFDTGDHAVLISHTANDILTTQTGLYSDHDGIFIGNSFGVFGPGNTGQFPSSFFYWTDLVSDIKSTTNDNTFALTTPDGNNVPAPWVPFTRAGCDVGAFSTANIVLERAPFDVIKVFGAGSPEATDPNMTNNYIGAAIHCAKGSALCSTANRGVADTLPDEPGVPYGGPDYQALFGLKYILPVLNAPAGILPYTVGASSDGVPITGFSQLNFDPTPAQTLAVVETMLKQGIPVVFAYIADAHDNQEGPTLSAEKTFGPGEAPYVTQLQHFDAAFNTFFTNLKNAGIDETNTLFIFTPDEGDHFVGTTATPANCDGVNVSCTYGPLGSVGEIQLDLDAVTAAAGNPTLYTFHTDDAATVYVNGNPATNDPSVRALEQTMGAASALNPHTGLNESLLGTGLGSAIQGALVDQVGQKLLHMSSASDPLRNPTFTLFGNPNFFFVSGKSTTPVVGTSFAWNHGDIQPEIARTFIGMAGPGVANLGITQSHQFFTDHVDVRPTMMYLTGLQDDYAHDGRVILEMVDPSALPRSVRIQAPTLLALGQLYKQIDAPFGQLAQNTLKVSTYALLSNDPGDATYNSLESKIANWTTQRDALAVQLQSILEGAEFDGKSVNEAQALRILGQGIVLLLTSDACAANPGLCARF